MVVVLGFLRRAMRMSSNGILCGDMSEFERSNGERRRFEPLAAKGDWNI
jgi:hypothetical protein